MRTRCFEWSNYRPPIDEDEPSGPVGRHSANKAREFACSWAANLPGGRGAESTPTPSSAPLREKSGTDRTHKPVTCLFLDTISQLSCAKSSLISCIGLNGQFRPRHFTAGPERECLRSATPSLCKLLLPADPDRAFRHSGVRLGARRSQILRIICRRRGSGMIPGSWAAGGHAFPSEHPVPEGLRGVGFKWRTGSLRRISELIDSVWATSSTFSSDATSNPTCKNS